MTNRLLLCTGCKKRFDRDGMVKLPAGWFHSTGCAVSYAQARQERARKRVDKDFRAETRQRKDKLKGRSEWIKEAQIAFNAFIRSRDKDLPCISCGSSPDDSGLITGSRIDCGHYRSVGAAKHLRFNENNAAAQCVRCNRNLSGNVVEMRKGLIERIGLEKLEALENDNTVVRLSIDEIKAIKEKYKRKLKEMKDGLE